MIINEFIPVKNIAKDPYAEFIMDPMEQLKVYQSVTPNRMVLGVFHSHPLWSNTPSPTDIRNIRDANFVWAIWGGVQLKTAFYLAHTNPQKSFTIIPMTILTKTEANV